MAEKSEKSFEKMNIIALICNLVCLNGSLHVTVSGNKAVEDAEEEVSPVRDSRLTEPH